MSGIPNLFPDVPFAPGVPPVPRLLLGVVPPRVAFLIEDALAIFSLFAGPQWGIFDNNGQPLLVGDSCYAVEFDKEFRISDYPVEQGGFASYNKVATPFRFKIVFTQGGTENDRQAFLLQTEQIVESLALFQAVTPTVVYPFANAVRYNYSRTAREGASLLLVEIFMEEVRQTGSPTFANVKSPASAGLTQNGIVQPGQSIAPPTGIQ